MLARRPPLPARDQVSRPPLPPRGQVRGQAAGTGFAAALRGAPQSQQPRGPFTNVDPMPERGSLQNPHTDTMGPRLARPVSNAGTNGSNARYHVGPGSGLTRGERGWTDGVYWYDDNGLSLDRPDAFVQGLGPANESEGYDPWSGRSPSMGGQAHSSPVAQSQGSQRPRGYDFAEALLSAGRSQPAGLEASPGVAPAGSDPQSSLAALLKALLGGIPRSGQSRSNIPA